MATPGFDISGDSTNYFNFSGQSTNYPNDHSHSGRKDSIMNAPINVESAGEEDKKDVEAPGGDVEMSDSVPEVGKSHSGLSFKGVPVDPPSSHVSRSSSLPGAISRQYKIHKSVRATSVRASIERQVSRVGRVVTPMDRAESSSEDMFMEDIQKEVSVPAVTETNAEDQPALQDTPSIQVQPPVLTAGAAMATPIASVVQVAPTVQVAAPVPSDIMNAFNTYDGTMPSIVQSSVLVSTRGHLPSLFEAFNFERQGDATPEDIAEVSDRMCAVLGRVKPDKSSLKAVFLASTKIKHENKITQDEETAKAFAALGAVPGYEKIWRPEGLEINPQIRAPILQEFYSSKQFFFITPKAFLDFCRDNAELLRYIRVLHIGFEPNGVGGDYLFTFLRNMKSLQRLVFHDYRACSTTKVVGLKIFEMLKPMFVRLARVAKRKHGDNPFDSSIVSGAVKVIKRGGADAATDLAALAVERKIHDEVKAMLQAKSFDVKP